MSHANPTYVRNRELLEAEVGDELVALDVSDGLCFGFNEVAASVWRLLAQPISIHRLVDRLADEYEVSRAQCDEEVRNLLFLFEERRLVRAVQGL